MTNDLQPVNVRNKDIWQKLDGVEELFHAYCLASEKRISYLEATTKTNSGNINDNHNDIDDLKKWDKGVAALAVVGSTIAGIFGMNK